MSATTITVPETLVLLAHRRDTRKMKSRLRDGGGSLWAAVSAAVVIDLIVSRHLELSTLNSPRNGNVTYGLRVLKAEPTGVAFYDSVLEAVGTARCAGKKLEWWLDRGKSYPEVVHHLVVAGVVRQESTRFGPFVSDYRLEAVDVAADARVRDRFYAVLGGVVAPAPRDALIASLVYYGKLWPWLAPMDDAVGRDRYEYSVGKVSSPLLLDTSLAPQVASVLSAMLTSQVGSDGF